MAGFGLLAWSVIDNAAPAGGALTGELIGHGLCAMIILSSSAMSVSRLNNSMPPTVNMGNRNVPFS